ncbi:MAG TPA: hypothetical protein VGW77_28560 [Candidatus Binatia bacterium]|jgi:hypothetical protein|nr:hypothetical protein [Candidatus Binatia bacterium]
MGVRIFNRILCAMAIALVVVSAVSSKTHASQISGDSSNVDGTHYRSVDTSATPSFMSGDRVFYVNKSEPGLAPGDLLNGGQNRAGFANDLAHASLLLSVVFLGLAVLISDACKKIYDQAAAIIRHSQDCFTFKLVRWPMSVLHLGEGQLVAGLLTPFRRNLSSTRAKLDTLRISAQ